MAISKGFRYKDKEGKVTDYEYGVNGSNVTQDSEHRLVTDEEKQTWNDKADLEDIPSGSAASHAVANNCTTTAAGSVLDARQGKVLMDKANQLSSDLGGLTFGKTAEGEWGYKPEGADAVIPFKRIPRTLVGKQSGTCNANAWGSITKEIIPASNTMMVVCSDYQSSQYEFSVTNGTYEPVLLDNDSRQNRINIYQLSVAKGVSVTITYDFYRPTYGGYATMFIFE